MSLLLILQYRMAGTPTPPPTPHEPSPPDIGGGGGQGGGGAYVNQWRARRDKLRRENQLEEEELLAVAQIAAQQLIRDHAQRQAQ
jgi:hypothetical protein